MVNWRSDNLFNGDTDQSAYMNRITDHQGPDLYAFIGFIGPDDINYMCWTFSDNMCYILVIKY